MPSVSDTRSCRYFRFRWNGCARRMSTSQRSNGAAPSVIQRASAIPAPPEDTIPIELYPAATQYPSSPGASPR